MADDRPSNAPDEAKPDDAERAADRLRETDAAPRPGGGGLGGAAAAAAVPDAPGAGAAVIPPDDAEADPAAEARVLAEQTGEAHLRSQ
jgi:hypothetical protein